MQCGVCFSDVVNCETRTGGSCAVTQWSDWSNCGTNCNSFTGTGTRKRFRSYVDENEEETKRCEHTMEEEELCPPPTLSDCPASLNQSSWTPVPNQTPHRKSVFLVN